MLQLNPSSARVSTMTSYERALAAEYLRVSTDQQRYSLECQRECIAQYASERGFAVIATYVDRAKSGLSLKNRPGLKQLIVDVTTGVAKYRTILVYDISRWGRFQDTDEAGHYEFLCKSSGIPVRYCAEQFENNDTATSSIMKSLKRTMAAEYSRELGNKVLAGQRRIAQLGYRSGGAAPYGYSRVLISADRTVKQQLSSGDRKGIATDRVILFPGPKDEVACVRQIYRMFNEGKMSFCAIARLLNAEGHPYVAGRAWT